MGGVITKKVTALIIFVTLLTIPTALGAFDPTNLAFNPGFETGNLSDWFTGGDSAIAVVSDNGPLASGSYCVQMGTPGSRDLRSQGIPVTVDKVYQLTFDYKTSADATGNPQVRFRFWDSLGSGGTYGTFLGELQRTLDRTNGEWFTIDPMEMIAPEGAVAVDIVFTINVFGSFTGDVSVDNVAVYSSTVEPPPDPNQTLFPTDGTMGLSDELTLQWPLDANASSYQVYLGTDRDLVDQARVVFLPGDLNQDTKVNLDDFSILASQWLSASFPIPGPVADINGDQNVNVTDLETLAFYFTDRTVPPAEWKGTIYQRQLSVSLPAMNQDYYWRVDPYVNGQSQKGATRQFNCDDYLDYGIPVPQHIYYIENSALTRTQQVLCQSLQGLIARQRPELFIRNNSNTLWLNDLTLRYGISNTAVAAVSGGIGNSLDWALDHYAGFYNGYILCDAYNDPPSLTAAVSLAAALPDAIVVDVADESFMTSRGKTKLADMRGLDEKWVWDHYQESFTKKAIFVQRDDITTHGAYLRDLPIAIHGLTWWYPSLTETETVFAAFRRNIPCFGWDSAVRPGEGAAVKFHSQHSMYTAVTDWMLNLSLYAGMASLEPKIQYTQPCSDNVYTPEENVHYVAFCMSDMDNVNTVFSADGWAQNAGRYGNSHRGQFAMGWGMAPIMMKIGPTVMKWWYDNATEKDCFIGYCSGLDYCNPSQFPDIDIQMSHLDKYLRQADLRTMCIIDNVDVGGTLTTETYPVGYQYAALKSLRGFFLAYDEYHGKILWFNGKPMVTGRYCLWNSTSREGISSNGQELAASINALPTDPHSEDGYTFVIVHAWSYGWDEVAACIDQLNNNVRVVTPNELIEQLYLHHVAP